MDHSPKQHKGYDSKEELGFMEMHLSPRGEKFLFMSQSPESHRNVPNKVGAYKKGKLESKKMKEKESQSVKHNKGETGAKFRVEGYPDNDSMWERIATMKGQDRILAEKPKIMMASEHILHFVSNKEIRVIPPEILDAEVK